MAEKEQNNFHSKDKEKIFCLAWLCENVLKVRSDLFAAQAEDALRTVVVTCYSIASDLEEEDVKVMLDTRGGNA